MKPWGKRILTSVCLALLLVLCLAAPLQVSAAVTEIYNIDITVELADDGSGVITEIWDVNAISDMTEWYLARYNLDNSDIYDLSVTDETGRAYEYVDDWDINGSIDDKAGKCSIYYSSDGPEICWGIGSFGQHTFTIRYTMSNIVKGYNDANALYQQFVQPNLSSTPQNVDLRVRKSGTELTLDNTGVWAFGHEGMPYGVENGEVFLRSEGPLNSSSYVTLLVEFDKNMFSPQDTRSRDFGDLLEEARYGSDYGTDYGGEPSAWDQFVDALIGVLMTIFMFAVVVFMAVLVVVGRKKNGIAGKMTPEYKDPPYSRELPWKGSLPATYSRLSDLRQLSNDGALIGAYILRWIETRQVDIVPYEKNGLFGSKTETTLKLYQPRPNMEPEEGQLYNMLIQAAGSDYSLQNKEFEKWSKSNFSTVQSWTEACKNNGIEIIRNLGAATIGEKKSLGGLFKSRHTVLTPLGEKMTLEMFGFKKYLLDFTIINEREAREVQLWNDYLVFAQLFGIADKVAEQFRQLYPDYFRQMAEQRGMRPDFYDVMLITYVANNYGRAMADGYKAGYNEHISRDSGGGGFSSGGGGGSASGSGSGGGGR